MFASDSDDIFSDRECDECWDVRPIKHFHGPSRRIGQRYFDVHEQLPSLDELEEWSRQIHEQNITYANKLLSQKRDRARGMLIGLALGDAISSGRPDISYEEAANQSVSALGLWSTITQDTICAIFAFREFGNLSSEESRAYFDSLRNECNQVSAISSLFFASEVPAFILGLSGKANETGTYKTPVFTSEDPVNGIWYHILNSIVLKDSNIKVEQGKFSPLPEDLNEKQLWEYALGASKHCQFGDFLSLNSYTQVLQGALCVAFQAETDFEKAMHLIAANKSISADVFGAAAGSLVGALHGEAAIPVAWKEKLHGPRGMGYEDLVQLADETLGVIP